MNLDCRAECSKYDASFGTEKHSAPVKTIWSPGVASDLTVCNARLGFGNCSLCQAHVAFWKNPTSDGLTVTPYRLAEIYPYDRILYDYDVTNYGPALLQAYIQDLQSLLGCSDPTEFTAEQWSSAWIEDHHFLPLVQTSILPFEVDVKQTEEYLHNAGCVITTLIREHFATLGYFGYLFEQIWQSDWETLTSPWGSLQEEPNATLTTAAVVPWDAMVASSLQFAFEDLERGGLLHRPPDTRLNRDL